MHQHHIVLYMGPQHTHSNTSINVGNAFMAKIVIIKDEILYRSTYTALSQEEWDRIKSEEDCRMFMQLVCQRLGP